MTKREEVVNTVIEVLNLQQAPAEENCYKDVLDPEKEFLFFQLNAILEDRYGTEFDIYSLRKATIGETVEYIMSVIGE